MQFSMNPDPASWVSIVGGAVAFDQYPDGSFQFRVSQIPALSPRDDMHIVVMLKSTLPAAIMAAAQVIDALGNIRETQCYPVQLFVQTLPDQRGDKPGKEGACISARVSARMLANTGADSIVVHDVHSPASLRYLIEARDCLTIYPIEPLECFKMMAMRDGVTIPEDVHVVAVDMGARTRVRQWADAHDGADMIFMDKKRDEDGRIIGHEIVDEQATLLKGVKADGEIWVIDDLCDGGATFISVSKALQARFPHWTGPLKLYVTHGLFSQGKGRLLEEFAEVRSLFDYSDWRSGDSMAKLLDSNDRAGVH